MKDEPLFDDEVIDITPRRRKIWPLAVIVAVIALFIFGSPLAGIYIDALWFSSIGYADVYWFKFRLGGLLFAVFLTTTFLILRLSFALLTRALPALKERSRLRLSAIQDIREINLLPLIYRPAVWIISVGLALKYAISFSQEWSDFALYFNSQSSGASDPVFNLDISFYLFRLPAINLVSDWLLALALILFAVITAVSLYHQYNERMRGFGGETTRKRVASIISLAAAPVALTFALSAYLGRYDLLGKRHNLFTGLNYVDYNVRMPGLTIIAVVLLIIAVVLVTNALVMKRARLVISMAIAAAATWAIAILLVPQMVQSLSVNPNELAKESVFIQHNIDMTRRAFALDGFEEKAVQTVSNLTAEQVQANEQTIDNIRLWDEDTLKDNFGQNQAIRTYYEFRQPDVDRYRISGRVRQVMVAAREMNVDHLQEKSRNWINQHLIYTHGYGVTMSSAGEFTPEGGPVLLLRNMPVESSAPEIKITRPEIYFGEVTNSHIYIHTKPQGTTQPEFNYPAPAGEDSYTEFEGQAGIEVGGWFRQLALSYYLGDGTNLLLSDYITPQSRVLMRRNVMERARTLAPFLLFDQDPYIVITRDGRLVWMIDAYTYSNRYPYSTSYAAGSVAFNYLRNSVKLVIDAYDGSARFYVFEPDDPIIRSYQSIFPSLFIRADEMPEDLREHIRYPHLLASAQSAAYTLYHIQNAQTFYNREDLWAVAALDPGTEGSEPLAMSPYYVLMHLPGEEQRGLEFVSILPFTPAGPNRNNMIGLIAQRSDGDRYGHTIVFGYPKNITVNGPAQIKARVNQDAQLSQLVTLWNQQGSRVIRGSLQAIPIGTSLLYIEPIYLQAVNSPLPELKQVAVASQDKLVSGKTFDEALALLFPALSQQPRPTETPAGPQPAQPAEQANKPAAQPASSEIDPLAARAQQLLSDYERLTSQGRHREAGEKLDQLKQTLAEMNRRRSR
jgi:hypothetical protein